MLEDGGEDVEIGMRGDGEEEERDGGEGWVEG